MNTAEYYPLRNTQTHFGEADFRTVKTITKEVATFTKDIPVVGTVTMVLDQFIGFVVSLDKSEARKHLAAERGQYEEANRELITQNFQLDNFLRQLDGSMKEIRTQLLSYGFPLPAEYKQDLAGCDFLFINCDYNAEMERNKTAKGVYEQLQAENQFKRSRLIDFKESLEYLRDYLSGNVTKQHLINTLKVLGVLGAIGWLVYSSYTLMK